MELPVGGHFVILIELPGLRRRNFDMGDFLFPRGDYAFLPEQAGIQIKCRFHTVPVQNPDQPPVLGDSVVIT